MADKLGEQLSALMDDECEVHEYELILRRLAKDQELCEQWQRYHLISDVIKRDTPAALSVDFSARVQQAIIAEAVPTTLVKPWLQTWFKPAAGFALAATLAAIAVLGLRPWQTGSSPVAQVFEAGPQVVADTAPPSSELDDKLNLYLINHNSLASMTSVQGVLPYVRMVGYQTGR